VAIPTDTVYGIAAAVERAEAIERIYEIKGRETTKAIPVLVSSVAQLERCAGRVSAAARDLTEAFWPGALTIVVEAAGWLPEVLLAGGTTVGLRMPASADALAVIEGMGGALAVTSANPSGEPEARSADEVRVRLGGRVDFVLDGGPSPADRPSTVVDASGELPRVLRQGALPADQVLAVLERAR
jgi:L-threonylcarbamoyladenylate synthase